MKQLTLNIPNTCSEKWDSFIPTSNEGRFCNSCSKEVIDFTHMSDVQILEFFSHQSGRTCGRFRPDQMKHYSERQIANIHPGFTLLKAGLLSLVMLVISKPSSANALPEKQKLEIVQYQNHQIEGVNLNESKYIVRGVVKSEYDGSLLPGINVYLKGTDHHTMTDVDGQFLFPVKLKAGDVLVFSFIGLTSKEYVVPNENRNILEIVVALSDDVTLLGEVSVEGIYIEHPSFFHSMWQKVKEIF